MTHLDSEPEFLSYHFLIKNYKQIILLLLVFLIIFVVEYITYINAVFFNIITKPMIPGVSNVVIPIQKNKKQKKSK